MTHELDADAGTSRFRQTLKEEGGAAIENGCSSAHPVCPVSRHIALLACVSDLSVEKIQQIHHHHHVVAAAVRRSVPLPAGVVTPPPPLLSPYGTAMI